MRIKVGMIGLTHPHSAAYLRTLDLLDRVEQVVVYDPDAAARDRARQTLRKAGDAYGELDRLLDRTDVPVVLVTLPNDVTPDVVIRAAQAGKHVICEKPGARSAAELRPVLDALERHRARFTMAYMWRVNPAMRHMRDLVQAGALGRLTSVELRMVTTQVRRRNPSHWLFKRDVAGGGILSWLACHWLDVLRFLTGQEVASVAAMLGTLSGEVIDVEDVASVAMRLTGGALVSLHAGYLLATGAEGYEGASYDRGIVLRGTAGTIALDFADGDQVVRLESVAPAWQTAPRQEVRFTLPKVPAYGGAHGAQFVDDFLESALTGTGANPVSAADALRVLEILDAIYESAEAKTVVDLVVDGR